MENIIEQMLYKIKDIKMPNEHIKNAKRSLVIM